jgi:hypothetical protein
MTGLIDHVASFIEYLTEPDEHGSPPLAEREALLCSSRDLLEILESSPGRDV